MTWASLEGRLTTAALKDGRTLRLYDDRPGREHHVQDRRSLPDRPPPAQMRRDPLTDEWVVYAAHRQDRTHLPAASECPLCPSTAASATEVPVQAYDVAVFDNRFPSLPAVPADGSLTPSGGWCEVVCFTSDHGLRFSQLPMERLRTVALAWVHRTQELATLPGIEQVLVFENRGVEIGVTLEHPHGQIYAFPFVPRQTARALGAARRHAEVAGSCLWCDAAAAAGDRLVASTEHAVAYVPFASRWPFAVDVVPRRHVADLADLAEDELDDLLRCYRDVLQRFDRLFGRPAPYIAAWHQAPVRHDRDVAHLRAEVLTIRRAPDKLKYLAGCETTTGVFINDVLPEEAALRLRSVASVG